MQQDTNRCDVRYWRLSIRGGYTHGVELVSWRPAGTQKWTRSYWQRAKKETSVELFAMQTQSCKTLFSRGVSAIQPIGRASYCASPKNPFCLREELQICFHSWVWSFAMRSESALRRAVLRRHTPPYAGLFGSLQLKECILRKFIRVKTLVDQQEARPGWCAFAWCVW